MEIHKLLTPFNHNSGTIDRIKYIVIHYVGATGGAEANCKWYAGGNRGASAHYYVDFDGSIWQSVEDKNIAWHCGASKYIHPECRNVNSIGIELCVRNKGNKTDTSRDWYFEDATIKAAIELTKELMKKHNIPAERVIRHHDVTGKLCLPIDSTELLTKKGWVSLNNVKKGDIVATYNPNTEQMVFDKVLDVVEPYISETIQCRGLEATKNHRMYVKPSSSNSHVFRDKEFGFIISGCKQYIIKNAASYTGKGIELTDDQIRFLVWVQGDGHYMKNNDTLYGILFHLKKERKINRLTELLRDIGIDYSFGEKCDGSVGIRINDKNIYRWCEEWLERKQFTYKFIEMTDKQFEVFWNELLVVDGNVEKNLYSSCQQQNLDAVQAVCVLHNVRTNKCTLGTEEPSAIIRTNSRYTIGGVKTKVDFRDTKVSCVTVPTGYILIRQRGKTFIVGNCPNPYVYNHTKYTWDAFKTALAFENPSPTGWEHDGAYRYIMPDGKYATNQWLVINHHWYLFGPDGYMLTGWPRWNGKSVVSGTEPGDWYFLDNTVGGPLEGACWHEKDARNGAGRFGK